MVTRILESIPAAALVAPSTDARTASLHVLQLELEAQTDPAQLALLLHERSRLHESRDDLATAARDALEATKADGSFIEPLEALIGIALRSHSKGNLAKLFSRLARLSDSAEQKLQAALGLVETQLANGVVDEAKVTLLNSLAELPDSATLWLLLEEIAARLGDSALLLRAALGRAAHARSPELRSLLLQRAARLQFEGNDAESGFASLAQGFDEVPTWHALRTWEVLSVGHRDFRQAAEAATKTATLTWAALEEPEESALYQFPSQELRLERALAAQVRAIIYLTLLGDWTAAQEGTRQLIEQAPNSQWVQLIQAELAERRGDDSCTSDTYRALLNLLEQERTDSQNSDGEAIAKEQIGFGATYSSLIARRVGDHEQVAHADRVLGRWAPRTWFHTLSAWQRLETEKQPLDRVWDILEAQRQVDRSTWFDAAGPSPKTPAASYAKVGYEELRLAHGLSLLLSLPEQQADLSARLNQLEHATSLLKSSEAHVAYRYLATRLKDDHKAEVEFLRAALFQPSAGAGNSSAGSGDSGAGAELLDASAHTDSDRALAADLVRVLAHAGPDEAAPHGAEGHNAALDKAELSKLALILRDPWLPLAARLALGGTKSDALRDLLSAGSISDEAPSFWYQLKVDPVWPRIAWAWLLKEEGIETLRSSVSPLEQGDPFHIGLNFAQAGSLAAELSALEHGIEHVQDDELAAGWLFRLALLHLKQGDRKQGHQVLERLVERAPDFGEQLKPWLSCLKYQGDPEQLLSLSQVSWNVEGAAAQASQPFQALVSSLEKLCLTARYQKPQFDAALSRLVQEISSGEGSNAGWALDLACSLWVRDKTSAQQLFDADLRTGRVESRDSSTLTVAQKTLLLAAIEGVTNEEQMRLRARFAELRPSHAADLAAWVLAHRTQNPRQRSAAVWRMAKRAGSLALALSAQPEHLEADQRAIYDAFLKTQRDSTQLNPAQRSYLELAVFSNENALSPAAEADQLVELASALDAEAKSAIPETEDQSQSASLDAQLAQLCAGFRYAQAEQFERALECLEPLLSQLPSDLTLCSGLRRVANQLGRTDLEAHCTVELARQESAAGTAAQLWERAGVLYQEGLSDERMAEECFTAALSLTPGSPLSFDRVYRFAKKRGDRPRQVELLDARLLTAESDDLRVELLWEKARYCRMLGRRAAATRAITELLEFEPNHLPSLALAAELHLVDERWADAAVALRATALHPDVSPSEMRSAGLYAADLFERVKRPREAVELLEALEKSGPNDIALMKRRARALARTEDWGAAYQVFRELNDRDDTISDRLESAQMMLAIQRDQLREPEQLKESARRVLRDAPTDRDAIDTALQLGLSTEDRRHLLASARSESQSRLRKAPLDSYEIQLFSELCFECGDVELERVGLGTSALLGNLSPERAARLRLLQSQALVDPNRPWDAQELEIMVPPSLHTSAGHFAKTLAPYLTDELEATLDARGISPLMRLDEYSGSALRAEVSLWLSVFGVRDFELFLGGSESDSIAMLNRDLPTVIVGHEVEVPLSRASRARLAAAATLGRHELAVFFSQPLEVTLAWVRAAESLCLSATSDPLDETEDSALSHERLVERLNQILGVNTRERLISDYADSLKIDLSPLAFPLETQKAALRAAALVVGDPSIVRTLPDLIPTDDQERNSLLSDLIQFCLSDDFFNLRKKAGLVSP